MTRYISKMKNPFVVAVSENKEQPSSDGKGRYRTPPGTTKFYEEDAIVLRGPGEYGSDPRTAQLELAKLHMRKVEEMELKKLETLAGRTGMPLTQENGQRRYGPPLECGIFVPKRGSEVFVGKIPRDCYESELVPVFEKAGRIFEMRLMMDFSGTNRGYCFVQYFTPQEADEAIRTLNNYEIRPGRQMGVVKSVDNCRLFFGSIPKDKTEQEIRWEVDKLADGVVKVILQPSPMMYEYNRGFAFVEFISHRAAAMARRKLVVGKIKMWGVDIAVDWAEPPDTELDVKNLRKIKASKSSKKGERGQTQRYQKNTFQALTKDRLYQSNCCEISSTAANLSMKASTLEGHLFHGFPGSGQFNESFVATIQQQTNVSKGCWYPNYDDQANGGYHPATGLPINNLWCGVPGIPPSVYYSQWSYSSYQNNVYSN